MVKHNDVTEQIDRGRELCELNCQYLAEKLDRLVGGFNDAIITLEILLPQISESDKPSVKANIMYYKSLINNDQQ